MASISPRTIKVAVIGSGLAGLTAAYLLQAASSPGDAVRFEVHIFEKADAIGMDAASVSIPLLSNGENKSEVRVDVPMRSFQGGYYRNLIALYRHLGVHITPRDFSYSFSLLSQCGKMRTSMIYNGASGRMGIGMPTCLLPRPIDRLLLGELLAWLTDAASAATTLLTMFFWLAMNYVRLVTLSAPSFRPLEGETLRSWSRRRTPRGRLARWSGADVRWRGFVSDVVLPLFSAVCTAPIEDVWNHPAEEILEYIWLTIGTHHFVATQGSRSVIHLLTAPIPPRQIHLLHSITSLTRNPSTNLTSITFLDHSSSSSAAGPKEGVMDGFGHVVLATQADRAVPLLRDLSRSLPDEPKSLAALELLRSCAASVRHQAAEVVTHTFSGVLPPSERDVRDLNLISFSLDPNEKESITDTFPVMATHVVPLPRLAADQPPIYQTTNPLPHLPIPAASVLSRTTFSRAVLTPSSKLLVEKELVSVRGQEVRAGRSQGGSGAGIWVVGSWCAGGIPLLEGCVISARAVTDRLVELEGIIPSWEGIQW